MSPGSKISDKTLELLGLKPKDFEVYVALLRLGNAPIRKIAEEASINRGTTYDALKRLINAGLASYVDGKRHRYFAAADPHKLRGLATRREVAIKEARLTLDEIIPGLQNIIGRSLHRPSVRYFEGESGIREILHDVLESTERAETKSYYIYSTADIRDLIENCWPNFTKERIKRSIRLKAIAIGAGGIVSKLAERKWMTIEVPTKELTYIFIYPGKTAYVSVDETKKLFGVIIEDEDITDTQLLIFESLWAALPNSSKTQ